jgi:aspartate/methionine/tyrosine aminotransferase
MESCSGVFSRRTAWQARKNALALALATSPPRFDLTQGNPTHARLTYPTAEIAAAFQAQAAERYDPDPRGLLEARAAVAARCSRRGPAVDPDRVLLCSGTSEAYGFLFKLLCDPGDEVLIPAPSYPLFDDLCRLENVRTRTYPLHYDGEWHIGLGELREAITEHTRAILIVSPNNPTGSYLKQSELSALEALDLPIISDEVFAEYPLREDASRVWTARESSRALTFSLGGLSKQAGLPQWKIAWCCVSGPEDKVRDASARLELVADTYLSVATPTQQALPELLELTGGVQHAIQARLARNLGVLRASASACSALTLLDVEGGFYATLRLPRTRSEEAWVLELLARDSVHVQPGYFFDFPREAYIVVSLLTDETVFDEGVERLVRRVQLES